MNVTRPSAQIESWEVLDLLSSLVQKSLVVYEEDAQGRGRYRLLETVRQYSRDRLLECGESEALRDRHRGWFLHQAERFQAHAWMEQEPYFVFTEAEHANLLQALEWSLHGSRGCEEALRLAGALWLHWFHAGAVTEAQCWLEEALARNPDAPASVRTNALTGLGMIRFTDDSLARRSLEESAALSRETGDGIQLLAALNALGYLYARDGDPARGKALLDEAQALGREHGEQFVVYGEFYGGLHAQLIGEYREAERLLGRVVTHERTWSSVRHYALAALGETQLELGQHALARKSFAEALVQARRTQGRLTILKCFYGLAHLWAGEDSDAVRSARLLGAAAAEAARLGMPPLPADTAPVERAFVAARRALEEPEFDAAFAQGQAMTLDPAAEYALEGCGS